MPMLAWRNLVHDRVRFAVTLTGIVFAVVLIVVEFGLFLGFTTTTSSLIDRSGADLWIIAKRVPYIELGVPLTERKRSAVLATPGVVEAEKSVARFTQWRRPDGRHETVQVVGFNLDKPLGAPWNIVAGTLQDLKAPLLGRHDLRLVGRRTTVAWSVDVYAKVGSPPSRTQEQN